VKKISAIVTCGNEAAHIQGVLESLSWCDECIVVDSYSEDGTPEIASRFTDKVWQRAYVSPADQKNWAIPQASHEWVLILDADERVTPALEQEIRDLLHANTIPYVAYRIFRINYFMGKRIRFSGWQHDAVVRFFHRDHGRYPDQMVHEELVADGPVGTLKGKLLHFTFKDREHYLQKIDRYARWSALDKESSTGRITWFHTLLKPAFRFVKHFILQGGVLDGYAGWVIATTNARGVALRYRYMLANRNATTS